jgi:hypothetical protein
MAVERDVNETYEDIQGEEVDHYYEIDEEEGEERMDEQRRLYQMRLEQQLEMELERQQYMMNDLEKSLEEEKRHVMMESPSEKKWIKRRSLPSNSPYKSTSPPTPPRSSNTTNISYNNVVTPTTAYASSHDSEAWREVMNSERRPRTAPPRGLDRESGIWSTTKSYVMNQSYMVGEAPTQSQRSGITVSIFIFFW